MLGMEFDFKLDVWSCGCVIYECLTGKTLFKTHNSIVHLCLIQKILGRPPLHLMKAVFKNDKSKITEFYDDSKGWVPPSEIEDFEKQSLLNAKPIEEELEGHKYVLIHLIKWMLAWDPQ